MSAQLGFVSIIARSIKPYKRHQSWLVRMIGSISLALVGILLATRLITYLALASVMAAVAQVAAVAIAGMCCAILHNTPKVADFLIDTHGEMQRVSWPSRSYIKHSMQVTAIVVVGLVVAIAVIDVFWNIAFEFSGFLVTS